jgi:hypothetical protein
MHAMPSSASQSATSTQSPTSSQTPSSSQLNGPWHPNWAASGLTMEDYWLALTTRAMARKPESAPPSARKPRLHPSVVSMAAIATITAAGGFQAANALEKARIAAEGGDGDSDSDSDGDGPIDYTHAHLRGRLYAELHSHLSPDAVIKLIARGQFYDDEAIGAAFAGMFAPLTHDVAPMAATTDTAYDTAKQAALVGMFALTATTTYTMDEQLNPFIGDGADDADDAATQ